MIDQVPVSVVIPTVGRSELVAQALESLGRCDPTAAEVLVVDQSADRSVSDVVGRFSHVRARLVPLAEPNLSRARNVGLEEAAEDVVLFIDDDCTVHESWAGTGWRLLDADPDRIVTGRVLGTRASAPGAGCRATRAGRSAGAAAVALGAGRRPPTISAFKYLMGQMSRAETVPVSVVIPTLGRPQLVA